MFFIVYIRSLLLLVLRFALRIGWRWWAAAAVVGLIAGALRMRFYGDETREEKVRIISSGLFATYVVLVLASTVFVRKQTHMNHPINLDLFGTLARRLQFYSSNSYEVLLNVLLFVPIGFLLIAAVGWGRGKTVLVGLALSVTIELLQLALSRGTCELSDVFTNTAGMLLGYSLFVVVRAAVLRTRSAGRLPNEEASHGRHRAQ